MLITESICFKMSLGRWFSVLEDRLVFVHVSRTTLHVKKDFILKCFNYFSQTGFSPVLRFLNLRLLKYAKQNFLNTFHFLSYQQQSNNFQRLQIAGFLCVFWVVFYLLYFWQLKWKSMKFSSGSKRVDFSPLQLVIYLSYFLLIAEG